MSASTPSGCSGSPTNNAAMARIAASSNSLWNKKEGNTWEFQVQL